MKSQFPRMLRPLASCGGWGYGVCCWSQGQGGAFWIRTCVNRSVESLSFPDTCIIRTHQHDPHGGHEDVAGLHAFLHDDEHTHEPQPRRQQLRVLAGHAAQVLVLPEDVPDEKLPEEEEDEGRDGEQRHDEEAHPGPELGRGIVPRAEGLRDERVAGRRRPGQEEEGQVVDAGRVGVWGKKVSNVTNSHNRSRPQTAGVDEKKVSNVYK